MERLTQEFIENLGSLESIEDVESSIINEVDQCKTSLQEKGYSFNTEEYTDELEGGQVILTKDASEIRYIDELVHIKRGVVSDEWVARTNDLDCFDEIKDRVEVLLFKFD